MRPIIGADHKDVTSRPALAWSICKNGAQFSVPAPHQEKSYGRVRPQ